MTPTPRTAKPAPTESAVDTAKDTAKAAVKDTVQAGVKGVTKAGKTSPPSAGDQELLSETEVAEIRAQLETDLAQMEIEYKQSMEQLNELQRTNTDGAGDDQADAGSKTFEREQEQSIANNRHDLLIQTQRAIARIDAKTYGRCEVCGKPIPKERLKAIPMATLDAACKAREERR